MFPFILVVLAVSVFAADDIDYHETMADTFDFAILTKEDFKQVVTCLTEEGPCDELHGSYKQHYPAAIIEGCKRCTPIQKRTVYVYFDRVARELPEELEKIKKLYDPTGLYFDTFMQNVRNGST